jgi:hypothetical protein
VLYPCQQKLTKDEQKGIWILLTLLKVSVCMTSIRSGSHISQPLESLTKILSQAGVPVLASIIVHYDSLNHEYTEDVLQH